MKVLAGVLIGVTAALALATPGAAKVGDPAETFASSPLINQLSLNPQSPVPGGSTGQMLYRYVSDDNVLTVDIVARGGRIEQQVLYVPMDVQRGVQVGWFLQDAIGSVVGSTYGLNAFRAAVANRHETFLPFGGYMMRFTPLDSTWLRVLVSR